MQAGSRRAQERIERKTPQFITEVRRVALEDTDIDGSLIVVISDGGRGTS